jgi:orotidine-5'-phosphate decarboxylase
MVNVHASGGRKMMETAREALANFAKPPKLIAVTVLTSMAPTDLAEIGISVSPAEQVLRLAKLTQASGLDGVVCSAQEAAILRQHLGRAALESGASYLVIGRPITKATDPLLALQNISKDLGEWA